jgi:hypothetical protein
MSVWKITCPNCGTENTLDTSETVVDCGKIQYSFTCINCQKNIEDSQEYWRWLELEENPSEDTS